MTIRITTPIIALLGTLACVLGMTMPANAGPIWMEVGDAGQLPSTAQPTIGTGSLDAIQGNSSGTDDIDMFRISIPDPSVFSATTVGPNTDLIDTQLFLFDQDGRGIAANGDTDLFSFQTNATIPTGSVSGASGNYLLAVSQFGDFPVNSSGAIFPDLFLNSSDGEVVGPTGPGGAEPVSAWSVDGFSEPFEAYEIQLTGASFVSSTSTIPEPSSFALFGIGAAGLFALGYSKHKRSAVKS